MTITIGSHEEFSQDSEYFADLFATFPETVPSQGKLKLNLCPRVLYFNIA